MALVAVPETPSEVVAVLSDVPELPDVFWVVREWTAIRGTRELGSESWTLAEVVPLKETPDFTQDEWERRFQLREKLITKVKATKAYRSFAKTTLEEQRSDGEPLTPRVVNQCSKREFDQRLKKWRTLLGRFESSQ